MIQRTADPKDTVKLNVCVVTAAQFHGRWAMGTIWCRGLAQKAFPGCQRMNTESNIRVKSAGSVLARDFAPESGRQRAGDQEERYKRELKRPPKQRT